MLVAFFVSHFYLIHYGEDVSRFEIRDRDRFVFYWIDGEIDYFYCCCISILSFYSKD